MTSITFPFFNIKLELSRIAFSIGNINIYWYAIFIAIAFIIAIFGLKKDSKKYKIDYNDILELMIITIPISIISARLYYIIFNLDYYSNNLIEMINPKFLVYEFITTSLEELSDFIKTQNKVLGL